MRTLGYEQRTRARTAACAASAVARPGADGGVPQGVRRDHGARGFSIELCENDDMAVL